MDRFKEPIIADDGQYRLLDGTIVTVKDGRASFNTSTKPPTVEFEIKQLKEQITTKDERFDQVMSGVQELTSSLKKVREEFVDTMKAIRSLGGLS